MEANEAPEKIYVKRLKFESAHGLTIVSMEQRDDAVEYTRTDAFIEKASEWLRYNNDLIDGDVDDYVEDFKNYLLKGE